MLKNIPSILSPDLLKVMMEMGHGDTIIIADGNFPASRLANRLIRLDGLNAPEVLDAMLKFFPLDTYSEKPIKLMATCQGDTEPPIWETYSNIVDNYEPQNNKVELLERFDFYEESKNAYCIIATSEKMQYANIILTKGVIKS